MKVKAIQREKPLQKDLVAMFAVGRGHRIAILFAVPNGDPRHPVVAEQLVGFPLADRRAMPEEDRLMAGGQGVLPGAPDLILLAPGGSITLIEVKVEEDVLRELDAGRQSREQNLFQKRAQALGFDYRIITNQTAFWDLCAEKGVPLRCHRPWHVVHAGPVAMHSAVAERVVTRPRAKRVKATAPAPPLAADGAGRQRWEPD